MAPPATPSRVWTVLITMEDCPLVTKIIARLACRAPAVGWVGWIAAGLAVAYGSYVLARPVLVWFALWYPMDA